MSGPGSKHYQSLVSGSLSLSPSASFVANSVAIAALLVETIRVIVALLKLSL